MNNALNTVTITKAKELIIEAIQNKGEGIVPNIMLHGSMGLGKSSIVNQAATELGYSLKSLYGSSLEASDVMGIPYVVDGEMRFSTPTWFPEEGVKTILFLDEITNCSVAVQHAFYRLILDRSIQNGKRLHDDVVIIAAGNLRGDKTGAKELVPAANNRFGMHLIIDSTRAAKSFLDWGMSNGIDRDIVAFLSWKNENTFVPPESGEAAFPTPRSWEQASNLKKAHKGSDGDLSIKIAASVGTAVAVEFMGFLEYSQSLPEWERLYNDPKYTYNVPKDDIGISYALSVALAFEMLEAIEYNDERKVDLLTTLVNDLDLEIKIVFFRTMKRREEQMRKLVHFENLRAAFKEVTPYIVSQ